uniref:Uncharacterized protein n=1 Tax=Tetranychus urticae TaxID=32264 RepID=T1JUH1_TETUR
MNNICACFHCDGTMTMDGKTSGEAAITNFQDHMYIIWDNDNIKVYTRLEGIDTSSLATVFESFYRKSIKDDKTVVACLDPGSLECLEILGLPRLRIGPIFGVTLDDVKSDYGTNDYPFCNFVIGYLQGLVKLNTPKTP